jgi:hypothetical protein
MVSGASGAVSVWADAPVAASASATPAIGRRMMAQIVDQEPA